MNMNLTLAVNDLARTEHFYRTVMGISPAFFSKRTEDNMFFILTLKNIRIVFQQFAAFERQHPALYQNLSRTALGAGVQFELAELNLNEIERSINRAGWPVIYELDDDEHQRREIWVQDPDGYLLVLNQEDQGWIETA